jgi:hypothetical protein
MMKALSTEMLLGAFSFVLLNCFFVSATDLQDYLYSYE